MPVVHTRTKAIGYIRVSTDHQADHGVSLAAQRTKLEAYAALYDIELVGIIEDAGASAKTLKRPGLQQALAMLTKGEASALLVCKLDRLTRSVKDLGILVDKYFLSDKITLLSVADSIDTRTAAGRMVLNILGTVAQWERETISERTSEAMAHIKALGHKTGGYLPYGYMLASDGKTLVPDADEQEWIALIRTHRQKGLSLRAIASTLEREGIRTRKGTCLSVSQICRILKAA